MDEMDSMFRSLKTGDSGLAHGISEFPNSGHSGGAAGASASGTPAEPSSPGLAMDTNTKNEIAELTSKLQQTRRQISAGASATLNMPGGKGGKKNKSVRSAGMVKPISLKDERILNQAIDYVNEISARYVEKSV